MPKRCKRKWRSCGPIIVACLWTLSCGGGSSGSSSSSSASTTTFAAVQSLTIDSSGNFILNGSSFLPLILYDAGVDTYTSVRSENATLGISNRYASYQAQLVEIQSKGFNTIIAAPFNNYQFTTEDFTTARDAGLYVIPRATTDVTADAAQFAQLLSQTNLLMWNTYDEPDAYSGGMAAARTQYQTVRAVDDLPVVVPIADVAQYANATAVTDVLFGGAYFLLYNDWPAPHDLDTLLAGYGSPPYSNFATVQGFMESSRSAIRTGTSGKTFIPIINLCPFTTASEPSAAQVKAMSFLALLYNAKGLAYFAFVTDDPTANVTLSSGRSHCYVPESATGLWDGFASVFTDVNAARDYVFASTYSGTVSASNGDIHVGAKSMGTNRIWLLAVNATGSAVSNVTISAGATIASVSDVLSSTSFTASGSAFTDSFSAYGVRVYDVRF